MSDKRIYECVAVNATNDCTDWELVENTAPLSKADAHVLTIKIIGFMVFVFILKFIKKSIS